MTYLVMLAVVLHGATVGSTSDEIDASTPEEAEALAISAWTAQEPRYAYRPLLTLACSE
jgi:hypothetical protein